MTSESLESSGSLAGLQLGNLRLLRLLGQGGMGSVYLAEHLFLRTKAAVKVLHGDVTQDAVLHERFRREALFCSQLRHPNIVFVTDFGINETVGLYLSMEYLEGESLFELLHERNQRLDVWRAISIAKQVCSALEAAHALSIVHRDLKPENIFLVGDMAAPEVKVFDFGIARMLGDSGPRLTEAGMVLGTPEYLAPEHLQQSDNIGPSSDLYALGMILFEMLTGETPFNGTDPMKILHQHVMQAPPLLSSFIPELAGSQLEQLIGDMIAKLPLERPSSATVALQRLEDALHELQEKGYQHAFPPSQGNLNSVEIVVDTGATWERLSGTISLLRRPSNETRLTRFFHAMPGAQTLPLPLFFSASWGLLLQDLNEHPVESETFQAALRHLSQLLVDLLYSVNENDDPEELRSLLFHAIDTGNQMLTDERKTELWKAIDFLSTHELFPTTLQPEIQAVKKRGWRKTLERFFSR